MVAKLLEYKAGNLKMHGQLVQPPDRSSSGLGILVFPDAFGLGPTALKQAERFAALGHQVLACDLHGEGRHLDGLPPVLEFVGAMFEDPDEVRLRAKGAMDALIKSTRVSRVTSVGYCFGGSMGLELARSGASVAATMGLHCGVATKRPADAANVKGSVLVCLGADDPIVQPAERQAFEAEMRAANVSWQLHLYGGVVHSFTDPSIDRLNQPQVTRYDQSADNRSFAAIKLMLDDAQQSAVVVSA
jgi:dienelactone hydrolase